MRRLFLGLCAVAFMTGLAATAASGDGGPSPGISWGWDGVLARNGQVRYVTLPAGRTSVLAVVRVRDGRVLRFRSIRDTYGVPLVAYDGTGGGVSRDGRRLVLSRQAEALSDGATTRFLLLGTRQLQIKARVALYGVFSFDALSPDASTLYLIQHLPGRNYTRYQVRAYDLEARRLLRRAIVDPNEPDERMSGQPLRRAESNDGRWAYTLYTNPGSHPFIHALDTVDRTAVCIDLEWHGSQDRLWTLRLVPTRDGAKLRLVNGRGQVVMSVDAPQV
jgi:hypothetical protein